VLLQIDTFLFFSDSTGDKTVTEPSDIVLEVHCPRSVYQTLRAEGKDKQTLGREARESLALRLYGEHRLSLGKAAELAALPIVKFMDLLHALQMPVVEYGEDEYAQDLQTIADLTGPAEETR
jgi:predicted HTH domain antitoxin